jgi:hypothetical protein
MAIASLSRFTVPLASGQSASSQGLLFPKLKYRFRITMENFGTGGPSDLVELTKQVSEAARPNVQFDDQTIMVYNSTIHYAGRPKWNTFSVKLRDDVNGNVSKLIGQQMQKQYDFFEQSSAAVGGDYKFLMRIEMLDGGNGNFAPKVLEEWECYGCYVTQANYNALGYGAQDVMTIDLTIQPDNCIQTIGGADAPTARLQGTAATSAGSASA